MFFDNWIDRKIEKKVLIPQPSITYLCAHLPTWVFPMAFSLFYGLNPSPSFAYENNNRVRLDDDGNMILHKEIFSDDWERHPELIGVKEIWITCSAPNQKAA